ncbi:unnamed protein product, partial [marine sediment metagenome]
MIKWKNKQIPFIYLEIYKWMKNEAESPLFISYPS